MQKNLIFAILWLGLLPAGCAVNPVTGQEQLMLISPNQELQIGREYAPEVEKQLGGRIQNQELQNYVNNIGQQIAAVSHTPELAFHYVALNHESINAVALPGGYIFITRGMLENLNSADQLACVLAHETTHVTARHSAQAMSTQIGLDLLLSVVTSESTPQTAVTVANVGSQILGLKYSRNHELQADSIGADYAFRAGYSPDAMIEVMRILESQNSVRPIEFFSSHPNPETRIQNLQNHIVQKRYTTRQQRNYDDYRKLVLENLYR